MQSIDLDQLNRLTDNLNAVLKDAPEERRALHEQLAEMAKEEVDSAIASSVGDSSGKIADWQESHVGSGGGYAAVRAQTGTTGSESPGAITNYLENGHKIPRPSGTAKHYKPAIKTPYVEGRHFYEHSRTAAESRAIDIAEDFADKLAERLAAE